MGKHCHYDILDMKFDIPTANVIFVGDIDPCYVLNFQKMCN